MYQQYSHYVDAFITVEQWTRLPVDVHKSVFVISYFTGIAGALVALKYKGYHVVHVAYSETDEQCLRVLRARFPAPTFSGLSCPRPGAGT